MSVYCVVNARQKLHDTTRKIFLNEPLMYSNAKAHCFRLTLMADNGTDPADLTGVTATANFLRPDHNTVPITDTVTITGNVIDVVLPNACYSSVGRYKLTVDIGEGTGSSAATRTALIVEGITERNVTDTYVDPGTIMPSINTLISEINDAVDSIPTDYDTLLDSIAQTFSASANYKAGDFVWHGDLADGGKLYRFTQDHAAGAWTGTDVAEAVVTDGVEGDVRYDASQTLTAAQQEQARGNIGAQARIEPDGAVTLDLSDSASAYISGNVGQTISYKSATASKVYKRIAWVQAGCEYVLSATSGVLASANTRVCAITDASNIILQRFDFALVENGTGEVTFTAAADGLLCVCVDTSTTTVAMHGGAVYGTIRYNTAQTLTDAQQAQARVNVGAASQDAIAPSDTTTAATQHTAGSLLTVGGMLYKATQPILAGDTITPGTNVTKTDVAEQLTERIAAETAAREAAIAGLPMSAGAYFAGLLCGNGTTEINRKRVVVTGNHIHMEGMGTGTSASTYAMFNTLGTTGGASGQYSDANVKNLFTAGKCYTGALLFATGTAAVLRIAYNKQSISDNPAEWDWGFGLYTYDASTDTLTQGVHQYNSSSANGLSILEFALSADFIAAAQANGKLALVIYGKSGAQWLSSKIDLYWEIIPVALTT